MGKTIFIFNDGTGQSLKGNTPTNVAKLFWTRPGSYEIRELADGYKVDPKTGDVSIYIRGIGTDSQYLEEPKEMNFFEKLCFNLWTKSKLAKEQITGRTIVDRIQRSYSLFKSVYKPDDEIVLIGFSRGAASIRLLASELIAKYNVKIKYMLVFDTVYSVAGEIKILDNAPTTRFTNFDIHQNIVKCDHLIAGDEMREKFPFSPVNKRNGVQQILFSGSHSDVGGGHKSTSLSDITLKFSLDQLENLGYTHSKKEVAKLELDPKPGGQITFVVLGGIGQKHFPRKLQDTSFLVHKSVLERSKKVGSISIALAMLNTFKSNNDNELIDPKDIDSSFDL